MSEKQKGSYTVVARRYRPQAFADLVGQPHVITALSNAIEQHRVGHAYLFTGARGVGKTSTARIFAKCLNCLEGPTTRPCNECEVCQAVSVGEDVDVLEIDGASNRGIDEIRQLRSNANIRPSRCRYKIYIIDEVHMLTTPAFNALLKTLEEPPEHVKFIFCTTDPHKIPITVISRCQKYDFAPVEANEISTRLRSIAEQEGVKAEEQALALIARRAAGSMRDSQSLLEQILAFCDQKITVQDVYSLLGTADLGRVLALIQAFCARDSLATMNLIDEALKTGVDVGQLAQQIVGVLRDLMATKAGCSLDLMLTITGAEFEDVKNLSAQTSLETIFSMLQIIDQAITRMQHSHHSRVLLESSALRCCELENLQSISDLIAGLGSSGASTQTNRPNAKPAIVSSVSSAVETNKAKTGSEQKTIPEKKNEVTSRKRAESHAAGVVDQRIKPITPAVDTASSCTNAVPTSNVPLTPPMADNSAACQTVPCIPAIQVATQVDFPPSLALETVETLSTTTAVPKPDASFQPARSSPKHTSEDDGIAKTPSPNSKSSSSISSDPALIDEWTRTLTEIGDMTADFAADFGRIELSGGKRLKVWLNQPYSVQMCNRPERKLRFEEVFGKVTGKKVVITFESVLERVDEAELLPKPSRRERQRSLEKHPFVKSAIDTFQAEVADFRDPPSKPR